MKKLKPKTRMSLIFSVGIGAILLLSVGFVMLAQNLFITTGISTEEQVMSSDILLVVLYGVASVILGTFLSFWLSKAVLSPVHKILDGMETLSKGDFSVRIDTGKGKPTRELDEKFNALAIELSNIELLRSDFVNAFSHEFKTPIVSINGLVNLLRNENLPKKKRLEYLAIIEEETSRLSDMTTKILQLSNIESQNILTNVTRFNLSEQIRTTVLLLERKWSAKNLIPVLDFKEYEVLANEDLLKQVWINLLDNAIKFSNDGADLLVEIEEVERYIKIKVSNTGDTISEENLDRIFQKFYRTDASHFKDGNGIGLYLVKHIVELHKGKVTAESADGLTSISVLIPTI